jgi:hypothetical protein
MKGPIKGIIISAFAILIAVAGGGCNQQESQGTKRTKLIAAENMRIKKELADLEKEIESLKQLHQLKLVEKQSQLNRCQREKQAWQQKAQENIQNQVTGVLDIIMNDIKKLRQENERLKATLERITQHSGSNRSLREEVEKLKEQMEIEEPLKAP